MLHQSKTISSKAPERFAASCRAHIAKVDPPSDAAAHTSKPLVYGPLEALCRPLLNSATIFHRRSRDIPLLARYFTASASGRSLGPFSQGRWPTGMVEKKPIWRAWLCSITSPLQRLRR